MPGLICRYLYAGTLNQSPALLTAGRTKDGIPSPLEGIPSLIYLPLHCQLKNHGLNWLYLCPGAIPPL